MSLKSYFSGIYRVTRSIITGMGITLRYFFDYKRNTITIQYPHERDHIPPRHRGLHYLETEKCVMCWKCSDICPVDCIHIEGIRGTDGPFRGGYRGKKATLFKFTVDYTVCIFCGLCEEPCPPACIYLGPEFDYKATDRNRMEKNLLTDALFTEDDQKLVDRGRQELARIEEEKQRLQEEKKRQAAEAKAAAAKAAAEKAAAEKAAAEKADGGAGEGGASVESTEAP